MIALEKILYVKGTDTGILPPGKGTYTGLLTCLALLWGSFILRLEAIIDCQLDFLFFLLSLMR